jgi:hypothetical protein
MAQLTKDTKQIRNNIYAFAKKNGRVFTAGFFLKETRLKYLKHSY